VNIGVPGWGGKGLGCGVRGTPMMTASAMCDSSATKTGVGVKGLKSGRAAENDGMNTLFNHKMEVVNVT
jgi:hypothetical protein